VLAYLSRFTSWIPAHYEVRSLVRGKLYPFPINLDTLEQFFGRKLDAVSAQALLEKLLESSAADPAYVVPTFPLIPNEETAPAASQRQTQHFNPAI
jgi:UDP-galactopyranose mutase